MNENDLDKYIYHKNNYHKNILRFKDKERLVPDEFSSPNLIKGKRQRPNLALGVGSKRRTPDTVATPDFISPNEIPGGMNQKLVFGQEQKPRAPGFKKSKNVGNRDSVFGPSEMIDPVESERKSINVTPDVTSNVKIQTGQVKKGFFPYKDTSIDRADISNPEVIQAKPVKGNNMNVQKHNYVIRVNEDKTRQTPTVTKSTIGALVKVKPVRLRNSFMLRPAMLQSPNAERKLSLREKNFFEGGSPQPSKRKSKFRVGGGPREGADRVLGEKKSQNEIDGKEVADLREY